MKTIFNRFAATLLVASLLVASCKKEVASNNSAPKDDEIALKADAERSVNEALDENKRFSNEFDKMVSSAGLKQEDARPGEENRHYRANIVQIAQALPIFKSLVAAVVKTDLAATLSSADLNATVFAPTDAAFAKLPEPFNNATNISAIADPAQIDALKNILLYHVLGQEVKRRQVSDGRSSVTTLKPAGSSNDNTIYLSKVFGLIAVNGSSLVLIPDVDASNGVIHVINNVLLPPSKTIADIATGDPNFSALVAALVKTDLVSVFTGAGDFTVFAPTDAAFAKLPEPFNNAANITAISDPATIAALANILKYHVTASRSFTLDLGFFSKIETLADAPNNTLRGILGISTGYVKGNQNSSFTSIKPSNLLATNGVVHVVQQVLQP